MPPRRKYFDMYDISSFKIKPEPVILGIESSCDETACAVIRGRKLLSSCIISSAAEQAKYGGVVPEIASRAHTEAVDEVVLKAFDRAGVAVGDVDAVAVTYGAGAYGGRGVVPCAGADLYVCAQSKLGGYVRL